LEDLVAKGLVKANIHVEQCSYIFDDGRFEAHEKASSKKSLADAQATHVISGSNALSKQLLVPMVNESDVNRLSEPNKLGPKPKSQASEFISDYFQPKKIYKANKRPRTIAVMAIIFAAIIAVTIFLIINMGGKNSAQPEESGKRPLQATEAVSSRNEPAASETNYLQLIKEANDSLDADQFDLALKKAEQAERIKPSEELTNLKREINSRQLDSVNAKLAAETRQKEELRKQFLKAYETLRADNLALAKENLDKAKQIRNGPDIREKEIEYQSIQARIEEQKELMRQKAENEARAKAEEERRRKAEDQSSEKARNNYLSLSRAYLAKGNLSQAMNFLMEAKKIRTSPESIALENRIEELYAEKLNSKVQGNPRVTAVPAQKTAPVSNDAPAAVTRDKILPGKISDLSADLAEGYSSLVKRVEILGFESTASPSGFVMITMRIDEEGVVQVKDINDNNLSLEPVASKQALRSAVAGKFNQLRFQKPRNRNGERITIESWRLNFKVGKFSGKVIMNRQ
jgi:tetratricopeptide (TPR) repeat protein